VKSKIRRILALALALTLTMAVAACGGNPAPASSAAPAEPAAPAAPAAPAPAAAAAPAEPAAAEAPAPADGGLEPVTIEVYSQPANFNGEQPGWTAKLLKDQLNVTLNIIAPQAAGQDIFAARSAAGFLGDLVVLDNVDNLLLPIIKFKK
jgi:putative aldouronate transport system substrate-binding protein